VDQGQPATGTPSREVGYVPSADDVSGPGAASYAKTVVLHVGAPKTGTTFLQRVLWHHRSALADDGVLYPMEDEGEHFDAAMDLREMAWGGERDPRWEGAWERVAGRARAWEGPRVVISNELLGGATAAQVRRAVESLRPADVRVVFTTRDLARALPSDWQEQVKHTHTVGLHDFVDALVTQGLDAPAPFGEMFWGLHDPAHVLPSWAEVVGADRVHVVTVPQHGSPRDVLWRRFAGVVGLDPDRYDTEIGQGNTSLGAVEAELLRRANARGDLGRRLGPHYDVLVRVHLVEGVLAARPDPARIPLPPVHEDWAVSRSDEVAASLRAAGYRVEGDLAELTPATRDRSGERDPAEVTDTELLDAALDALAGLLTRMRDLHDAATAPPPPPPPPTPGPVKRLVHTLSARSALVYRLRTVYWRLANGARRLTRRG
jgi:hypothetical protein